jgi:two-component system response regulator DegU
MTTHLKALVVDDHSLIRKSISSILTTIPNFVCHEAENGNIALEKCRNEHYHIVFMDLGMPIMDGMTVIRHLKQEFPQCKVIILTMYDKRHKFIELMELGINGYLLKNTDDTEITKAVGVVMSGSQYITPTVYKTWTDYMINGHHVDKSKNLSQRELEVLYLICMEMSASEISKKLYLSEATINNHRARIMKKTSIHNTAGLVIYAIRNGIFIP